MNQTKEFEQSLEIINQLLENLRKFDINDQYFKYLKHKIIRNRQLHNLTVNNKEDDVYGLVLSDSTRPDMVATYSASDLNLKLQFSLNCYDQEFSVSIHKYNNIVLELSWISCCNVDGIRFPGIRARIFDICDPHKSVIHSFAYVDDFNQLSEISKRQERTNGVFDLLFKGYGGMSNLHGPYVHRAYICKQMDIIQKYKDYLSIIKDINNMILRWCQPELDNIAATIHKYFYYIVLSIIDKTEIINYYTNIRRYIFLQSYDIGRVDFVTDYLKIFKKVP